MINEQAILNIRYETATRELDAHHIRMRPRLFIDGDQWCALYGDDLQDGVSGFGKSPYTAMLAFDRAWEASLPDLSTDRGGE